MEYTGWSLYDNITLVLKENSKYSYPQAYLVNPKDKKQLARAIEWGTTKTYLYNENKEPVRNEKGYHEYTLNKPEVITVDNKHFKIELLESAHGSYQGGKQSFWNCLVYRDDIKFIIGIDSELLLHALKQSKFIYGKSEEVFSFARCSGGVGILHTDMKDYTDAIRDMEAKEDNKRGKTSKWELGRNYTTLTLNELYIGDVYKPINITYDFDDKYRRQCRHGITPVIIQTNANPKRVFTTNPDKFTYTSFKEYIEDCRLRLSNINLDTKDWISEVRDIIPEMYRSYNSTDKKPARKPGDVKIETYEEYYTDLQILIDNTKNLILEYLRTTNENVHPISLDSIFINTYSGLSDLDKELLEYIKTHVTNGYKVFTE